MHIVIAGGTGFLGTSLARALANDGYTIAILTRSARAPHHVAWTPGSATGPWTAAIDRADVVVNLAGESLADGRWTPRRKQRLVDSRVGPTGALAAAIRRSTSPPAVFVSMSGVGYYGACGDQEITEEAPAGADFVASLCQAWEQAAADADASPRTRCSVLRTGLVLARKDGALPRMLPPFRLGIGGPLGSGRQYLPWIHRDDWVAIVRWVIEQPHASGVFNATAPAPVTNRSFATTLGRVLHRPALLPAPGFALKVLLGEMAGPLLLTGQRAVPARALELGFTFRYPQLEEALREILGRGAAGGL